MTPVVDAHLHVWRASRPARPACRRSSARTRTCRSSGPWRSWTGTASTAPCWSSRCSGARTTATSPTPRPTSPTGSRPSAWWTPASRGPRTGSNTGSSGAAAGASGCGRGCPRSRPSSATRPLPALGACPEPGRRRQRPGEPRAPRRRLGALAARFPEVPIVIDHLAHPKVAEGVDGAGFRALLALARHPSVSRQAQRLLPLHRRAPACRTAGTSSTPSTTRFGAERLFWGSDSPHVEPHHGLTAACLRPDSAPSFRSSMNGPASDS